MELETVQLEAKNPRTLVCEAIKSLKAEGRRRINVIDLHIKTRLDFPSINKVMDRLEREGVVHAEDYS